MIREWPIFTVKSPGQPGREGGTDFFTPVAGGGSDFSETTNSGENTFFGIYHGWGVGVRVLYKQNKGLNTHTQM